MDASKTLLQHHVPGCGYRNAMLELNAAMSDTMARRAEEADRARRTPCTCRRVLGTNIGVVLKTFVGQELTEELREAMQSTVDTYMARTAERYGPNGWDVALKLERDANAVALKLERDANAVEVYLIPPDSIAAAEEAARRKGALVVDSMQAALPPHEELLEPYVPPAQVPRSRFHDIDKDGPCEGCRMPGSCAEYGCRQPPTN